MALVDLVMPKMGESIMEATILRWHKQVGDVIKVDETILDIATDKVDSEVPATTDGVLKEIIYAAGSVVPIGAAFARIETEAYQTTAAEIINPSLLNEASVLPSFNNSSVENYQQPTQHYPSTQQVVNTPEVPYVPQLDSTPVQETSFNANRSANNRFYSPLVLNIANSEGLALSELERIPGTGADGRVSKRDILQYIADKKAGKISNIPVTPTYTTPPPAPVYVAPAATYQAPPIPPQPIAYEQPVQTQTVPLQPVAEIVSTPIVQPTPVQEPVLASNYTEDNSPISEEQEQPLQEVEAAPLILPKKDISEPVLIVEREEQKQAEQIVELETTPLETAPLAITQDTDLPTQELITNEATEIVEEKQEVLIDTLIESAEEVVVQVSEPEVSIQEEPSPITPTITSPAPIAEVQPVNNTTTPSIVNQPKVQATPIFMPQPTPAVVAAPKIEAPLPKLADNAGRYSYPEQAVPSGNVEIVEMDRMRKLIAKHMVDSKHTSAHVTSFAEADVTNMVLWRNRVKNDFERRENTKITFTPMFIECIVSVLKKYPLLNASVEGDKIVIKKDFNIGMATALPSGNLIVPVIKAANQLNIVGLATAVNGLASAARDGKLKPEDTTQGTFTFTNIGSFGGLMGTPIINQPQVAILSVGSIKKRAVVIENEDGDTIGIRHMMYLSLSYDHRIIDGSLGSLFLIDVVKEMESWDVNRQWYSYI